MCSRQKQAATCRRTTIIDRPQGAPSMGTRMEPEQVQTVGGAVSLLCVWFVVRLAISPASPHPTQQACLGPLACIPAKRPRTPDRLNEDQGVGQYRTASCVGVVPGAGGVLVCAVFTAPLPQKVVAAQGRDFEGSTPSAMPSKGRRALSRQSTGCKQRDVFFLTGKNSF